MKRLALLLPLLIPLAAHAADFETREIDWNDAKRHRPVPAKLYIPKNLTAPAPMVIFSHGLGGSRRGYAYLGAYWASHGYIAVHLQHVGSDDSVWKGVPLAERMTKLKQAANHQEYVARTKDVSFAIDQLTALNATAGDPLAGKLDLSRIAMAGHSFGGQTTEAISGEVFTFAGAEISYRDSRVSCAIVMSPAPPASPRQRPTAFRKVNIPVLYLTGTEDESPIGETRPKDRRVPYDQSPAGDKYLIIFKGGDHMMFSGARLRTPAKQRMDDQDHPIILESTIKFFDAYLNGEPTAKDWLQHDLKNTLGERGTVERK